MSPTDISVDLLPISDAKDLEDKHIDAVPAMRTLDLRLLEHDQDITLWLDALCTASKATTSLIATPFGLEYEDKRLQRNYIDSLVTCGMPIPKSPSFQFDGSDKRQEREERGWWSLRFREVLREMVG